MSVKIGTVNAYGAICRRTASCHQCEHIDADSGTSEDKPLCRETKRRGSPTRAYWCERFVSKDEGYVDPWPEYEATHQTEISEAVETYLKNAVTDLVMSFGIRNAEEIASRIKGKVKPTLEQIEAWLAEADKRKAEIKEEHRHRHDEWMRKDPKDRVIVHKTEYVTDENTLWIEIDSHMTTDVRINRKPRVSYSTVTVVGEFSEQVKDYVRGHRDTCVWAGRNTFMFDGTPGELEAFIKEALMWRRHNVFIRDEREDVALALKLCYY